MPLVQCQHTDCIHCDLNDDFKCKATAIIIESEWYKGCSAYEDYRDHPDYQNVYLIAITTKSGEPAKSYRYRGKRIEYKGRVFYTSDRLDDKNCSITDAETGRGCGPYVLLEDHFDQICEQAKQYPKVETLPDAKWTSGGYELVKEGHK